MRIRNEVTPLVADGALEGDDGDVRLPPVSGTIHLVGFPVAAIALVFLQQPHLKAPGFKHY